jgi:predicted amidohydrolase YtcJ
MIVHISGHFAAVNSKGLEMLNITADSKTRSEELLEE